MSAAVVSEDLVSNNTKNNDDITTLTPEEEPIEENPSRGETASKPSILADEPMPLASPAQATGSLTKRLAPEDLFSLEHENPSFSFALTERASHSALPIRYAPPKRTYKRRLGAPDLPKKEREKTDKTLLCSNRKYSVVYDHNGAKVRLRHYCIVKTCPVTEHSRKPEGGKYKMFRIPPEDQEPERRKMWLAAMRPEDPLWNPCAGSRVCERHFLGGTAGKLGIPCLLLNEDCNGCFCNVTSANLTCDKKSELLANGISKDELKKIEMFYKSTYVVAPQLACDHRLQQIIKTLQNDRPPPAAPKRRRLDGYVKALKSDRTSPDSEETQDSLYGSLNLAGDTESASYHLNLLGIPSSNGDSAYNNAINVQTLPIDSETQSNSQVEDKDRQTPVSLLGSGVQSAIKMEPVDSPPPAPCSMSSPQGVAVGVQKSPMGVQRSPVGMVRSPSTMLMGRKRSPVKREEQEADEQIPITLNTSHQNAWTHAQELSHVNYVANRVQSLRSSIFQLQHQLSTDEAELARFCPGHPLLLNMEQDSPQLSKQSFMNGDSPMSNGDIHSSDIPTVSVSTKARRTVMFPSPISNLP